MKTTHLRLRQAPFAACATALCALNNPVPLLAATLQVSNCASTGAGSLRNVVAAANSGDTVDLSKLKCSVITVGTGGTIQVPQQDLTLVGPGSTKLAIYGAGPNSALPARTFTHTGMGTLTVRDVRVSAGYAYDSAAKSLVHGGCIYSAGNVTLDHTTVSLCKAVSLHGIASGGGVFAKGNLSLDHSNVDTNEVGGGMGRGGGAYAFGLTSSAYSTISNNVAHGAAVSGGAPGKTLGFGGGIWSYGGILISSSTISGNKAGNCCGGVLSTNVHYTYPTLNADISNSTISGNLSYGTTGGILVADAALVTIHNSTIAFNTAATAATYTGFYSPGLALATQGAQTKMSVDFQSSLIAINTYGTSPLLHDNDLTTTVEYMSGGTIVIGGSDNLILKSTYDLSGTNSSSLTDTVSSCPFLGPLRGNGGLTKTHALLPGSPGIDHGNNVDGLVVDQRGTPYVRASGPPGAVQVPDIGAFEFDQTNEIFANGFETTCAAAP
jgi:hypothetical protein